ncbi:MAG: MMPL family transporter, partial [Halobacteriales archaeon]
MGLSDRYAETITRYSRVVVVVMVVATLVVGSAAGDVESNVQIAAFESDSEEAEKLEYVGANFTSERENVTAVQVVFRNGDALSKESLLAELRLQRSLLENETVGATLADRPIVGLSNLVATAAIRRGAGDVPGRNATPGGASAPERVGGTPPLDAQIDTLQSMSEAEVDRVLATLLAPDADLPGDVDPYRLLPTDYERGSAEADARMMFVFQATPEGDSESERIADAQLAIRDLVGQDRFDGSGSAFAFGAGIVDAESSAATGDSFALISPFAFLLVVAIMLYVYRDPLDVALGLVGIVVVLVWMGGFMGWLGIGVTQILIAVPFLLIGLSIDYGLHVVMRYREARADGENAPHAGMQRGLAGVTVPLAATTFTTAVGFLANYTSPIVSIREFGLVSAAGIVAAFLVFAVLLPALKLELESLLERVGVDRTRAAFGRAGAAGTALTLGTRAARIAPVAVVVVGLIVAGTGGYAATDVETNIDQTDFLPRDSPDWMDALPGDLAPDDYRVRENAIYVDDNFLQSMDRTRAELLIEGNVTDPATLEGVAAGRQAVASSSSAVILADGDPRVLGPLSVMRSVARENESFAATLDTADADADGVPDRNLAAVYDALYRVAPERASQVIYREGGEYRAL